MAVLIKIIQRQREGGDGERRIVTGRRRIREREIERERERGREGERERGREKGQEKRLFDRYWNVHPLLKDL